MTTLRHNLPESHDALYKALDSIVGCGAQHENSCDRAEHADGGRGIWCEAHSALNRASSTCPTPATVVSTSRCDTISKSTDEVHTDQETDRTLCIDELLRQIEDLSAYASEQFEAMQPRARVELGLDVLAERIQVLASSARELQRPSS